MITNGYEFILNIWVHIFRDINIGTKSVCIPRYTNKSLFEGTSLQKPGRQRVHLFVDTKKWTQKVQKINAKDVIK